MKRAVVIKLLLSPSLFSGTICLFVSLGTVAIASWSYITHHLLFYDYFFGRYGVATTLLNAPNNFAALRTTINNSDATYLVLVIVAALIVGLVVFILLTSITHMISEAYTAWHEVLDPSQNAKASLRETFVRMAVRILSLVSWGTYWLFFITLLTPLCVVLIKTATKQIAGGVHTGWLVGLAALALLTAGLHIHVIFMRLSALRLRLWNNDEVEIAEQEESNLDSTDSV